MFIWVVIEDQNPNAAGWLEKYQINLDADILMANDSSERSALSKHHYLQVLMLGSKLWFKKYQKRCQWSIAMPKETEQVMTSGLSKDVSNSRVTQWKQWGWNPSPFQSMQLLGPEMNNPHTLVQVEGGVSDDTFTNEPGVNVWMNNKLILQNRHK